MEKKNGRHVKCPSTGIDGTGRVELNGNGGVGPLWNIWGLGLRGEGSSWMLKGSRLGDKRTRIVRPVKREGWGKAGPAVYVMYDGKARTLTECRKPIRDDGGRRFEGLSQTRKI